MWIMESNLNTMDDDIKALYEKLRTSYHVSAKVILYYLLYAAVS